MKRDFNQVLIDLEGKPFKDEKKVDLTLRRVVTDALGSTLPGDDSKTGDEKFKLFKLIVKVNDACTKGALADIEAEELTIIKERVGRSWNTLVMGPAYILLEKDPTTTAEQATQPAA